MPGAASSPDASVGGAAGSSGASNNGGSAAQTGSGGASNQGGKAGSSGSGGAAGTAGIAGSAGTAGTAGTAGSAGDGGTVQCDSNEKPGDGVFVSASAVAEGNGTPALPYKTITQGLASLGTKLVVYVDEGTYVGTPSIATPPNGLTISGGWKWDSGSWKRDCEPDARSRTVLASQARIGMKLNAAAGVVKIREVSILSKLKCGSSSDQPGESCFGIHFTGPGTLALDDVAVTAGEAGNGGQGSTSVPGEVPACGDGVQGCSTGLMGLSGEQVPPGGPGVFGLGGFTPGNGVDGNCGGAGQNGTFGEQGKEATCIGPGCSGGMGPCAGHYCGDTGGTLTVKSGPETCGCGGAGGPCWGGRARGRRFGRHLCVRRPSHRATVALCDQRGQGW